MRLYIVFIILFSQAALFGQNHDTSDYLVIKTGDTLHGALKYMNESGATPRLYKKFRLTDSSGKKKKIKTEDISSFRVNGIYYEGFWLSQSSEKIQLVNPKYSIDSKNGEKHFLRVVSKGALSHYELEWWEQGDAMRNSMDLLKKENDMFFMRATQGVFGLKKRILKSYFSDCPALAGKIDNKEIKDVRGIVNFYDNNCLN